MTAGKSGEALQDLLDAFEVTTRRLKVVNATWALTGSTNLCLQGIAIAPKDIDIISTKSGALAIQEALSDYVALPVQFRTAGSLRSNFGTFVIQGRCVEVFSDIQNLIAGQWDEHKKWEQHIVHIRFRNASIPVLSLDYERCIYTKLSMMDKVELINARGVKP